MNKFEDIPIDSETTIVFTLPGFLNNYEVVYESWIWENVSGQSVIFYKEDIKHLSDDDLKGMLDNQPNITISRKFEKYVFVNYNFKLLQ